MNEPKYRLLNVGETIQTGDEVYSMERWNSLTVSDGASTVLPGDGPIRRSLPVPTEGEVGEADVLKILVEAECFDSVRLTYDSGPYEITTPTAAAIRLIQTAARALRSHRPVPTDVPAEASEAFAQLEQVAADLEAASKNPDALPFIPKTCAQFAVAAKDIRDSAAVLRSRHIRAERGEGESEAEIQLAAWRSQFGTTQLSHAVARLEAAESEVRRLRATPPPESGRGEAPAQGAVAEVKQNPDDYGIYFDTLTDKPLPVGTLLYTHPLNDGAVRDKQELVELVVRHFAGRSCENPTGMTGRDPDDNCGKCGTCTARRALASLVPNNGGKE